jgi:hypothetical protein
MADSDKPDNQDPGTLAGVPEPHPPKGGPEANPDLPNPADLTSGFGGTSQTRPRSTEEDEQPDG